MDKFFIKKEAYNPASSYYNLDYFILFLIIIDSIIKNISFVF